MIFLNNSLGIVEVQREFMSPIPLEVMHINTSNIRRFTVMDPFTLDVMHVDGQYIPCMETLCLSMIKDDETGQWNVSIPSTKSDGRMRILPPRRQKVRQVSGALMNGMEGNWVLLPL